MTELAEFIMRPQFLVTFLAAISAFATVLTIALPLLERDRTGQRMKVMAVERDKMRAQRIAELSAKDGKGKLRQAPKGYMQQVVNALDLKSRFDNDEARNKLKMAGLRSQAHLVAYLFFRVALPPILFVVSLPIQAALLAGGGPWFGLVAIVALACWLVGFVFEAGGDLQLARFLGDPNNAGEVMDRGLWAYTRHPNYFGDFAIGWGHFGLAFALGAPWWTVVSPLIMSYLLMKVSGVPMLEKTMESRRPKYADYVRRTSAFFPRPPKPR